MEQGEKKERTKSEEKPLGELVERANIPEPVILLADRGYEAYNSFACLERKGWNCLIRIRHKERAIAYGIELPDSAEFDLPLHLTLGP